MRRVSDVLTRGLFFLAVLAGCSATGPGQQREGALATRPPGVELAAVPFFPQQEHACGPAALASLLVRSGVATDPLLLSDEIYLPGREGTLTPELTASVRRHGRLPEVLPAQLDSVFDAVAACHPVLVLQNLGLDWIPRWHYAVVVGYDLGRSEILLRSGSDARMRMSFFTFEKTWMRSGGFALIVLRPGEDPVAANAASWFATLAQSGAAVPAWTAATRKWPEDPQAWFGLGNAALTQVTPDGAAAVSAWREAIRVDPRFVPGYNNLALLLARRGALTEARGLIEQAHVLLSDPALPASASLREQVEDSRRQILAGQIRPDGGNAAAH